MSQIQETTPNLPDHPQQLPKNQAFIWTPKYTTDPSFDRGPNILSEESIKASFKEAGNSLQGDLESILHDSLLIANNTENDVSLPRSIHNFASAFRAHQDAYITWLDALFRWRRRVGYHAMRLIDIAVDDRGFQYCEKVYKGTKCASIWFWWRICKMVTEIEEFVVGEKGSSYLGMKSWRMGKLFLDLWKSLRAALIQDLEIMQDADITGLSIQSVETEGLSLKALLMQGDLFLIVPELECLPEPEAHYHVRDQLPPDKDTEEYQAMQQIDSVRYQKLWTLLKKLFLPFPSAQNDLLLQNQQKREIPGESTSTELKPVPFSRLSEQRQFNRPFRNYIHKVETTVDSDLSFQVCKEVRQIYIFLLGALNPPVEMLYSELKKLLEKAPGLFNEFEVFVAHNHLPRWQHFELTAHARYQFQQYKISLIEEMKQTYPEILAKTLESLGTLVSEEKRDAIRKTIPRAIPDGVESYAALEALVMALERTAGQRILFLELMNRGIESLHWRINNRHRTLKIRLQFHVASQEGKVNWTEQTKLWIRDSDKWRLFPMPARENRAAAKEFDFKDPSVLAQEEIDYPTGYKELDIDLDNWDGHLPHDIHDTNLPSPGEKSIGTSQLTSRSRSSLGEASLLDNLAQMRLRWEVH